MAVPTGDFKTSANDAAAFEERYVTTNVHAGARPYSPELVTRFRDELLKLDEEKFKHLSYSVLAALFIGAHRSDFVPRMLEAAIDKDPAQSEVECIYYRMRETIMAIWPFVGIPWVVPAALGSVAVLQRKGLEHIGSKTFREPMDVEKLLEAGKDINAKTYAKVNNSQVRELLTLGFPEMRKSMSALVWGYNVSGASKTGLLTEAEVELLIATAIVAGGATRQSKSHIKASLGMGNSFDIVEEVVALATEFNEWNNTPLPNSLSVEELSKEL